MKAGDKVRLINLDKSIYPDLYKELTKLFTNKPLTLIRVHGCFTLKEVDDYYGHSKVFFLKELAPWTNTVLNSNIIIL